jgi:hypothetical protein
MAGAGAATASAPLRAPVRRTPSRRRQPVAPALVPRLGRALAAVPEHRLLDRLVRGRFWIGFVAFALLGIVGLQLSLLKLNTGIGRAIEHQGLLERQNATLRAQVSSLSSGDRVETEAARMSMVVAPPGAIRFLSAGGRGTAARAARAMTAPAAASASAGTPAAAGATGTSSTLPLTGTSASPATSSTDPSATGATATQPATVSSSATPPAAATGSGAATGAGTATGTTSTGPTTTGVTGG